MAMQDGVELLRNELYKSNVLNLLFFMFAMSLFYSLIIILAFYLVRLTESKVVISCRVSFSSRADAISYVKRHPDYAKRLDRGGRPGPCDNLK